MADVGLQAEARRHRPGDGRDVGARGHLTNLAVADVTTGERSVLETTRNHPFWDATTGDWVDASKLKPGHRLLVHDEDRLEGDGSGAGSGGGGPTAEIVVVAVDNHIGSKVMRDLTVADVHTYHVLAGDDPVLVHNNNSSGSGELVGGCGSGHGRT